jgi:hypothetical protein
MNAPGDTMTVCRHQNLTLLPSAGQRLRCRHCHLTIDPKELGDSHCPECYEVHGEKRTDFETVEDGESAIVRYRCEDCGATIEIKD